MPIYEYQCGRCGHRLEALQKISDAPLTECQACHEAALIKLVSAARFRLKGGGWYETDFKQEGRRQLAESDSSGDKGSRDAGDGGTDKTDAGTDKKPDSKPTDSKSADKPAKVEKPSDRKKAAGESGNSRADKAGKTDG